METASFILEKNIKKSAKNHQKNEKKLAFSIRFWYTIRDETHRYVDMKKREKPRLKSALFFWKNLLTDDITGVKLW